MAHGPDEHDADLFDDVDDDLNEPTRTVRCPQCRAAVYADADRCGACGHWFTLEQATRRAAPWWTWLIVGLIVGLLILTLTTL